MSKRNKHQRKNQAISMERTHFYEYFNAENDEAEKQPIFLFPNGLEAPKTPPVHSSKRLPRENLRLKSILFEKGLLNFARNERISHIPALSTLDIPKVAKIETLKSYPPVESKEKLAYKETIKRSEFKQNSPRQFQPVKPYSFQLIKKSRPSKDSRIQSRFANLHSIHSSVVEFINQKPNKICKEAKPFELETDENDVKTEEFNSGALKKTLPTEETEQSYESEAEFLETPKFTQKLENPKDFEESLSLQISEPLLLNFLDILEETAKIPNRPVNLRLDSMYNQLFLQCQEEFPYYKERISLIKHRFNQKKLENLEVEVEYTNVKSLVSSVTNSTMTKGSISHTSKQKNRKNNGKSSIYAIRLPKSGKQEDVKRFITNKLKTNLVSFFEHIKTEDSSLFDWSLIESLLACESVNLLCLFEGYSQAIVELVRPYEAEKVSGCYLYMNEIVSYYQGTISNILREKIVFFCLDYTEILNSYMETNLNLIYIWAGLLYLLNFFDILKWTDTNLMNDMMNEKHIVCLMDVIIIALQYYPDKEDKYKALFNIEFFKKNSKHLKTAYNSWSKA